MLKGYAAAFWVARVLGPEHLNKLMSRDTLEVLLRNAALMEGKAWTSEVAGAYLLASITAQSLGDAPKSTELMRHLILCSGVTGLGRALNGDSP